ncbi:MAG TPA: hypothetical protein VIK86_03600 [Candidatus Paceibacterota bacterium]
MDIALKKAEEKIEYLSSDPKTLELYEARENSLHERANMISSAKEDVTIDITKNLLESGVSVDIIKSSTGLSKEQILQIKKELES